MASVVTETASTLAFNVAENQITHGRHSYWNLPQSLIDAAILEQEKPSFDPKKHLNYSGISGIHSMEELGHKDKGISNIAITEPFAMFTQEAIDIMRSEMLDRKVLEKHYCPTSPTSGHVRGHRPHEAPFTHATWRHPEVLRIISGIVGIELVPCFDYDLAHTNISVNSDGKEEQNAIIPGEETDKASEFCESAFGWHRDGYCFVCITMLSDCTGMIGGETKMRTGTGEVVNSAGPQQGSAVMLQGRYVEHQATAAKGGRERIASVVSFRPKDVEVKDESRLATMRNISHRPTLYHQYVEYRLEYLQERIRNQQKRLQESRNGDEVTFDIEQMRQWIETQKDYLDATLNELT